MIMSYYRKKPDGANRTVGLRNDYLRVPGCNLGDYRGAKVNFSFRPRAFRDTPGPDDTY
jgi:hypothetical protein